MLFICDHSYLAFYLWLGLNLLLRRWLAQRTRPGSRAHALEMKKRSENAGANETLSFGFPSIPRVAAGVPPRTVVFVLLKS